MTEALIGADAALGNDSSGSPSIKGAVTVTGDVNNKAKASSGSSCGGVVDITDTDPTAVDFGATEAGAPRQRRHHLDRPHRRDGGSTRRGVRRRHSGGPG